MKKLIQIMLLLMISIGTSIANNIQITNLTIVNKGPGAISVKFDLSWDNSWRTNVGPANYDGAWVFFKYKQPNGDWTHLSLTGLNNIIPIGFDVYQNAGSTKVGAMIYREPVNMGVGSVSINNIELGVINNLPYNIDVTGFALEMVYVPGPSGARPVFGDGNGTAESVYALHYTDNIATNNSVLPMKCDANGFDDAELETDGLYVYSNDTIQTTNPIGVLEPFPTMKALWCMKYEINQAAYRDFLNTLDSTQQITRTSVANTSATGTSVFGGVSNRNYLEIVTPASLNTAAVYGCDANGNNIYNEASDGEWVACNYLAWVDVAAYLDWSGLAPMSELQYERMCRGNSSAGGNAAVLGEYAWGTNTIFSSFYSLIAAGTAAEVANNASGFLGNAVYSGTTVSNSPLRSGVFATSTSNRITSGATYYGIMEMSGNMPEYCISLGQQAGRSCHYVPNGNGVLSPLGNAQLSVGGAGFWPGMEGNLNLAATTTCSGTCEVTSSGGIRFRGGSVSSPAVNLSVSDRNMLFTPTARANDRGGRGVLYIR